jgi:hypothetical protein
MLDAFVSYYSMSVCRDAVTHPLKADNYHVGHVLVDKESAVAGVFRILVISYAA